MNLQIFTTSRQIREWLKDKDNQFLDKHYTLGDFLKKIVVVDGKKFIDEDLRKKYLFEAIKNVDIHKLGISKEFIDFFNDSNFIFSFFNELFLEDSDIDNVILSDVYLDYQEHLEILKEIKKNYEILLEEKGYIDRFLVRDFRINKGLLEGIEKIELRLDGYLTKFDIKVLEKIEIPVFIYFSVDKFNKSLLQKSLGISVEANKKYKFDFHKKELIEIKTNKTQVDIDIAYFSERLSQVNYVFAKIAEFVESGISPENIAVILPDESFSEYLKLFDEHNNLNFAMGESFRKSNLYIKLKAIYDYLTTKDDVALKKCKDVLEEFESKDLIEFIREKATNKELKVIDEELFKLCSFKNMFESKREFLYFVLERLKDKTFDDAYSGKITCMGVLESRGIKFDGVILIDFNEDIVPNVSDSDLFLNTFIRKLSNLPTRQDKENLQKHYYYQLLSNAKKAAICYVKNEEKTPSRFLYELNLDLGVNADEIYKGVFKISKQKEITKYDEEFEIKYPLYPTTLKTLLECPKKYYFSKILEIKNEENEDEFFGNIFHNSIKKVVDNKDNIRSFEEYYKALMEEITSKINDKKLLFDVLVKWEEKIKNFCKIDFEEMKYSKNETEKNISFFYENKYLAARVDRIDIQKSQVVLIDYKTSKSALEDELFYPYEFQTTFYYLWAKENFIDFEIKTIIWDLQNSKKIEGNIKIEELKKVLSSLPKQVKEAEDIVIKIIDNNREKEVTKKASDICKWCEYKIACGKD